MSRAAQGQLWQSIQAELLRRIQEGDWPPGALIPGEVELAEEFGCARATVNRALRELAGAGLIERRRKAGTRVARMPVRRATIDIPIIRVEVEGRGAAYGHVLLDRRRGVPPVAVLGRLGLPAGRRLLRLRCVHMADGAPYAYEDRWINTAAAPGILEADLGQLSANEWLVTNLPWSHGDFAFEAVNAGPEEARALGAAEGAALLVARRTTWTDDTPITHVRLAYAPGHVLRTSA